LSIKDYASDGGEKPHSLKTAAKFKRNCKQKKIECIRHKKIIGPQSLGGAHAFGFASADL